MKIVKIIFLSILSIGFFAACKKNKDDIQIPVAEVAGMYEGKYGTGNNTPSTFYSFNLKADGTMEELASDGEVKGTGTWGMSGNTFTANHKYTFPANAFFVSTGTYDASAKKITGTWGYGSSNSDGGKWYMVKK